MCVCVCVCVCVATGQTLRCDVFVDTVHRIEITTRTRELLLEEEPERFEIVGYDEEGKFALMYLYNVNRDGVRQ